MQRYYDLEMSIMSCLLLKPKLMEELKVEDKHFKKHYRLWQFMKAFYKKYQTFDVILMFSVCKDKFQIIKYLQMLADIEPVPSNFNKYQDQLIELYKQKKKERYIIENIYTLANDLYMGNIDLRQFKNKLNETEENAEKIFKEEK